MDTAESGHRSTTCAQEVDSRNQMQDAAEGYATISMAAGDVLECGSIAGVVVGIMGRVRIDVEDARHERFQDRSRKAGHTIGGGEVSASPLRVIAAGVYGPHDAYQPRSYAAWNTPRGRRYAATVQAHTDTICLMGMTGRSVLVLDPDRCW
ncbi:hypothetical protein [Gordonia terrae]|uniref:hypothetical protein n=1 Tax=Gordonia terrae TaxID=2055 RepID=UPI0015DEA086|nr:hypothetical protein [Gordonia terrae]